LANIKISEEIDLERAEVEKAVVMERR